MTPLNRKWAFRFMDVARILATWSKDPSTQVGSLIVDDDRCIRGTGYNGFPRGVQDHPERYEDRELKYPMIVHAEANALLTAVKDVRGCTLITMRFPCTECCKMIIQLGIRDIIYDYGVEDKMVQQVWVRDERIARTMLSEAGVPAIKLDDIPEHHRRAVPGVIRVDA